MYVSASPFITMMFAFAVAAVLAACASENRQSPAASHASKPQAVDPRFAREAAQDFTLVNQDDEPVSLADARGKWLVLYFYPKDDTPGCTIEGREFTEMLDEFEQAGALVWGVSADSPQSHRAFREKCSLEVDLLSDPARDTLRAYGAWVETVSESPGEQQVRGRYARVTFLIDPQGRVAWHWPSVNVQGHAADVHARLLQLQRG